MKRRRSSASSAAPLLSSFPVWRAPYGTAKSGAGVASMGVMRPELLWPVLGIYGSLLLYQYWDQSKGQIVPSFRWLCPSFIRSRLLPRQAFCRNGYRNCW
ncbi:hypothetical protein ES319_A01G002600v1 [Gossypium barbadense]|uniref:Uncharacterized protein n=3 Tax=Gossypium TaxID=3633 RepID=A0A5J5WT12_GOSBA|nr:hypothetical protein ES319_A01G002600v1 [Gossypium barbadense]TYH29355.1 hypothetical protein ES288_A01G005000v1 [Gossypium darwinii]TYI41217.1 hypothetical protein ES332_A01G004500v1 [Gossypium tomentosum]